MNKRKRCSICDQLRDRGGMVNGVCFTCRKRLQAEQPTENDGPHSSMFCIVKTFVGRLGIVEKDYKSTIALSVAELQKRPKKCFAKLIHKALYGEEITEEDIEDPDKWPAWPVLPVRRQLNYHSTVGILLALRGMQNTVYEVNMFEIVDLKSLCTDPTITKHSYSNADEILAAGWEVD